MSGGFKTDWNVFFSFLGSATGCVAGILASQRLTNYRLQQLEARVDKHNNLVERMTATEIKIKNIEENLQRRSCDEEHH